MGQIKIAGIALVVVGLGLGWWGYQEAGSLGSQLSGVISGSPGDKVMLKYIGGAVCVVVGAVLFARK